MDPPNQRVLKRLLDELFKRIQIIMDHNRYLNFDHIFFSYMLSLRDKLKINPNCEYLIAEIENVVLQLNINLEHQIREINAEIDRVHNTVLRFAEFPSPNIAPIPPEIIITNSNSSEILPTLLERQCDIEKCLTSKDSTLASEGPKDHHKKKKKKKKPMRNQNTKQGKKIKKPTKFFFYTKYKIQINALTSIKRQKRFKLKKTRVIVKFIHYIQNQKYKVPYICNEYSSRSNVFIFAPFSSLIVR